MIVGDLTLRDIRRALAGKGIDISTGPFVFRIQSRIANIARHLRDAYADYEIAVGTGVDYQIGVVSRCVAFRVDFWADGYRPFHSFPRHHAAPLLEWGMNWCVYRHAHQFLIIHAAVVEQNGFALLLPGRSGSGKSTICAILTSKGYRLLSDELALLTHQNCAVLPIPRPISLKNESVDLIRNVAPQLAITGEFGATRKGRVGLVKAPQASVQAQRRPAQPKVIVFPLFRPNAPQRLKRLPKLRALEKLSQSAFNYQLLGESGFDTMCSLVQSVSCYELVFSDGRQAANCLEQLWARHARGQATAPIEPALCAT